MSGYYVYIMASERNGTLYIGMTNNIARRVSEHRTERIKGFTSQYSVKTLVYVEEHSSPQNAIHREKLLKEWNRSWKIALIEEKNPLWNDLWDGLF